MPSIMSIGHVAQQEAKRKNRWQLSFIDVPSQLFNNDTQVKRNMELALLSASRPSWNLEEVELHRLNEKFYVPGKATFEPITVTYQDYIESRISEVLFEWSRTVYNPMTGAMGYKRAIGVRALLTMLDPLGVPVEIWTLFGAWPQAINFQDLDMSSSEQANIEVTIRYDRCAVVFVNNLNPNSADGVQPSAFNDSSVIPGDEGFGIGFAGDGQPTIQTSQLVASTDPAAQFNWQ